MAVKVRFKTALQVALRKSLQSCEAPLKRHHLTVPFGSRFNNASGFRFMHVYSQICMLFPLYYYSTCLKLLAILLEQPSSSGLTYNTKRDAVAERMVAGFDQPIPSFMSIITGAYQKLF
jgi:hypothetical protein